ncbi:MAG: LacI family DNA-binding transcriptional regulator [Verrucomicrobia bacterium]|nr:LacI family DNA-binding transcriptional regulator [Verrucomicrobiota bacterium]
MTRNNLTAQWRNSRPTIRDVAEAAGVSTATVSNVVRGTCFVRAERQKKVLDAIETLGYSPNLMAAGLRARRSRMVGIVVPDITTSFFGSVVRRIEELASGSNYQILLADTQENGERELERVRALVQRQADGLILIPCRDSARTLEDIRKSKIPTVLVDRTVRDSELDIVSADNSAAAREGCRHLISLGHRKITFLVSDPKLRNITERIQGYREGMIEAGLSRSISIVAGGMTSDQAHTSLRRAFRQADRPSAIFAATHVMALGALRAIWETGCTLPAAISLLAFDDCEWMTALRPFLSTLRQPIAEMAQEAWLVLTERIQGHRLERVTREFPCTLVIRESTVPPDGRPRREGRRTQRNDFTTEAQRARR